MSGNIPNENRRTSGKSNQSGPARKSEDKKESLGSAGSSGILKNVKEKETEERRSSEKSAKSQATSVDSAKTQKSDNKRLSEASSSGQSVPEDAAKSQMSISSAISTTQTEERRRSSNKSDKSNKSNKSDKDRARHELMALQIQKIGQGKVEEKRTSNPPEGSKLAIIEIPDFTQRPKSPSLMLPIRQTSRQKLKFSSSPPEEFVVDRDTDNGDDADSDDSGNGQSRRDRLYSLASDYYDYPAGDQDGTDDADLLLSYDRKESRGWSLPNLHLDACLPEIRQFSSMPDVMFYMANVVNCICAVYMLATGSAAHAWENSVKSILIEDETKQKATDFDLGTLSVTTRGHLTAFIAVLGWIMSVVGVTGFYYAKWPLIKMPLYFAESWIPLTGRKAVGVAIQNMWSYTFICVIQLLVSLSVAITVPQACAKYTGMRAPMLRHLQKFYTDSLGVTSPDQVYQDHHDRIVEMQSAVSCCGLNGYNDYKGLPGAPSGAFRPPYSCCNGPWKLNMFCTVGDEKEFKKRVTNVGCEKRVQSLCYNIMAFFGYGGFIISLLLIAALICSFICVLYLVRIEKIMADSEVVYVERLNLFMPEIVESDDDSEEDNADEPGEKRLLADTDKIKLSDAVNGFVDQVRREYGMDDMVKKKRVIYKKTKKDKIILAPYEMKMAEKRKFSLVAGRHNYFLNRQMLKYAARIVTADEGDDSHAKKRIQALDDKMKLIRAEHKKEVAEHSAHAHASVPTSQDRPLWKFERPKKKPIPKSLVDYHKGAFEAKRERHKVREAVRKEKKAKDALEDEENMKRRKQDVLNRLLSPKLN